MRAIATAIVAAQLKRKPVRHAKHEPSHDIQIPTLLDCLPPARLAMTDPSLGSRLAWALSWTGSFFVAAVVLSAVGFLAAGGDPVAPEPPLSHLTFFDTVIAYAIAAVVSTPILAVFKSRIGRPVWATACGAIIVPLVYAVVFGQWDPEFSIDAEFIGMFAPMGALAGLFLWWQARKGWSLFHADSP